MENLSLPVFFSVLFYISFAIYLFFGLFVIYIDSKSQINRIFFILCIPMCIWAFSFSIAISAPDYDTAILWRRIAAIGWGTMYSFLLHFILIMSEHRKLLQKKFVYLLIYLPTLFNLYAFAFNESVANAQYKLVNSIFGWHNISANSFWDWIFNVYYVGFSVLGLILIWYWGRTNQDKGKKRQARIFIIAFVSALLLGTFTDIISNSYLAVALPQLAPVVILIPISAILYLIKRYHFMQGESSDQVFRAGKILNEKIHIKIYQYLSLIYIFGSMMNFGIRYFYYRDPIWQELLFNLVGIIIGFVFIFLAQSKIKEELQDFILILLMCFTIPYITLNFLERASITIWAIPIIFVFLSIVFNKRRIIYYLGICIIVTQLLVYIFATNVVVQVNLTDHLVRIGISAIAIWLALYINRIYIKRLKENEDQVKFQKMISLISAEFVTVSASNNDSKINEMLRLCGEYFNVTNSFLFLFSPDHTTMSLTHQWSSKELNSSKDLVTNLVTTRYPWWMDQILNIGEVYISDVSSLSSDANNEKDLLHQLQVHSMSSISVKTKGEVLGFLGFDLSITSDSFQSDIRSSFRILANLLADAILKVQAEKEIHQMAYFDALTGLSNRILFNERLEQAISMSRRTEKFIGVIFIDIDAFKSVNDTMGHEGGDELLKLFAQKCIQCVRKYDTVSRFGGDEFLILINQIEDVEDLKSIAAKIIAAFGQPVTIKGQEFFVTASAGVSVYPADGDDPDTLIKNADLAMYIAKGKGKNQFIMCSPNIKEDVLYRMHITNGLYRALEKNELVLYYQPQLRTSTQNIIGLEALIRWNHPELGVISPSVFIPLAEQTGLINSIGEWVVRTACSQAKAWQEMGLAPIRVAVNLSVEQIRKPNLFGLVAEILQETGLDAQYLDLEITESIAVKEAAYIIPVLEDLKTLGLMISIDDFGTEYSSLSRLKLLPVDRIKIDMQFVHGISKGNKDEAIAKIIIQLAKNLNMDVIAEGVETEAQFDFFKKQQCDEIQGFYFYRPLPVLEITDILINQARDI